MTGRRRAAGARILAALTATIASAVVAVPTGSAPAVQPLDAQRERVRALEAEMSGIDARTDAAADAAAQARRTVLELRRRATANATAAQRARRADARAQRRLEDRLVAIYTNPAPDALSVLLTSGSLSRAVAAQDAIDRAGRRDARILDDIHATRARLRAERRRLAEAREKAAGARAAADAELEAMEALLGERRAVLARAQEQLGRAERRARARALARAQAAAERAARRRARAAEPAPAPAEPASPAPARAPATASPRRGDGPVPGGPSYATLDRIARCESGGNPRAVSSGGLYRGKYQFDLGTWASVGGSGDPAAASEAEQDRRAAMLYMQRGPAPWPVCGYR